MKKETEKPPYYDGSATLQPWPDDSVQIIVKPQTDSVFDGIPYFPCQHETR
ncbi:hypothetical protein ACAF76_007580 [Brevibacillus sp. TJ4]|uniref:hypothetical protein n=1 Tax=Brevibacillus sp. TJ4 TaxID=3234853 RepID=UPI0037D4C639